MMESNKDHAGIYIPPPLLYAALFLAAVFIQKLVPLNKIFFYSAVLKILGSIIIVIGLFFSFPAKQKPGDGFDAYFLTLNV